MFVAVSILTAFKKEIRDKVIGFHGHIVVTKFSDNNPLEQQPVDVRQSFVRILKSNPEIDHIQMFASKTGIIKAGNHIRGVILKGIGRDYNWTFFKTRLREGKVFNVAGSARNDSVIISRKLAQIMGFKLYDQVRMYFIRGDITLGRKFIISGIYDTGLEEFDQLYVIGDIRQIQKMSGWKNYETGGFEIYLRDFNKLDRMAEYVYHNIGFSLDATTVRTNFQQIFDWLDLQDTNVLIILILVIMVSATTIVSTLLILILERTTMIGVLKALGMKNSGISKIFLYQGGYITCWGMLWGNITGFLLCFIQLKTGLVKLSEESYYMSVIPVNLDPINIALINLGTFVICYLIFLIPTMVISRISPVKAIRLN